MTDYTIRVQLSGATWDDYELLHARLAQLGLRRFIVSDDGSRYDLPDAEYDLPNTTASLERVRDAVVQVAAAVRPDPHVLISGPSGRAWRLRPL